MNERNLLKGKRILVIGEDDNTEHYASVLKNSGAEIIFINEDIDWQDAKFARRVAGTMLRSEIKIDGVLAINPDMPSTITESDADRPFFIFAKAMQQQSVPLIVQGQKDYSGSSEDELEAMDIKYCSNSDTNPTLISAVMFAEMVKKNKRGGPSPDF